jgi:hypothetical protein
MSSQLSFFASIAFSLVAWAMVMSKYVWPRLRPMARDEALRPILMLHSFRFIGLAFLVPGVVSPDLPSAFARSAAYGDIMAATLALLALLALATLSSGIGSAMVWLFSLWGTADLFDAFYQANSSGLTAGQLGAAYFIPTVIVPLLFVTHAMVFRLLVRSARQPEVRTALGAI